MNPIIFGQFGFPQEFAATVLIIENVLAVVMEPLMGGLSDQSQRWVGTRWALFGVVFPQSSLR